MSTIVWQEKVRIVTGEISRADFFKLAREIEKVDEVVKEDPSEALRLITDFAVIRSTHAVYIRQGEEWVEVDETGTFAHQENEYTLTMPPTSEMLDKLPASLALKWAEVAQADNAELLGSVFFGSGRTRKGKK